MHDEGAREAVGRVEALLERVETLPDPAARETATAVAQAMLDLYGEGLTRVVEHVSARDDGELAAAFAGDELLSHLLLLHGLHPVPLEERVRQGLEEVRPYLESHGGNVELIGVEDGIARVAMQGSCQGCPSSAMTLKLAIEEAIQKAAPDVVEVVADEAEEPAAAPGLIQLEVLPPAAPAPAAPAWALAEGFAEPSAGRPVVGHVGGDPVLFLRLDETLYAYRPSCPDCGRSLEDAPVDGVELTCTGCGHRYDARHAGRCLDVPELHLHPLPLLEDEGGVRVAVG